MKIVARLVLIALVIFFMAQYALIPGIGVTGFTAALIVSLVLGVLNILIRPILVLLTLPITLITLGLFTFVINALLFWGASLIVPGFVVSGFIAALLGSLVVSAAKTVIDVIL